MTYTLVVIFSFSIAIPAFIGWIRFKKINPAYHFFLCCIWLGLLNELISYFLNRFGYPSLINSNIYMLAESLLITWQFKKWDIFPRPALLYGIIVSFILLWIFEIIILKGITSHISYYRIIYSFAISLMSVECINRLITQERKNILKNPTFLICLAFVINYTYNVIFGAFWLYGLALSDQFMMNLTAILIYINFFSNLVYALAVLWMPAKHRFSLQY